MSVTNRLGKSLVAILLILSIGGHWALLQGVAWVTMVVDYSKEAPLSVAVSKTFDGQHPCNLCNLVRHGKDSEKKQEAIKVKTKIDFWMPLQPVTLEPLALAPCDFAAFAADIPVRSNSPPVPPPRFS
jgi:hypothetical protein